VSSSHISCASSMASLNRRRSLGFATSSLTSRRMGGRWYNPFRTFTRVFANLILYRLFSEKVAIHFIN